MKSKINIYLIEYAINSLSRQGHKTFFVGFIFNFLIFLLTSMFFITNSIKYELDSTVNALPEITVQKIKAGRHHDIDEDVVDGILGIAGVSDAVARVWGYYYFENAGVNFSIVGIDEFENQYKKSFENLVKKFDFANLENNSSMVVGKGVREVMKANYYDEYFNFIKPDGTLKKVFVAGEFDGDTNLESNDVIVMPKSIVKEIFDIESNRATDIVVKVANPEEIFMIARKIRQMYPDVRAISKDDLLISYQNIFDYKSGVFLALFVVCLFTFFIVIYDKLSGLSSQEKREVGILKALGWKIDDILKEKFYESLIISLFSYIIGVAFAFGYVYIFKAPILRDIFVGYSQLKTTFELPFVFDIQTLFIVFFLSVPIYMAAIIIPSWRVATLEADEVIR